MIVRRSFSLGNILQFTGLQLVLLTAWSCFVAYIYEHVLPSWLSIPWLPMSLIGTAVAFYLGFKNNSAYDRMWEARKIWGAIVNSSRAWGSAVRGFVTNQFADTPLDDGELDATHRRLLYRHIAWLYQLRDQLLVPTPWEHVSQGGHTARVGRWYQSAFGIGLVSDHYDRSMLARLLTPADAARVDAVANGATYLVDAQARDLRQLREQGYVDDFRHIALQKVLNDLYVHQGKCERIKKYPLPRQYAGATRVLVGIFVFLLPLTLAPAFQDMGDQGAWLSIPFTVLVSWVYVLMELVGDYSENPFQGMANDIPMLSLARTIEIDLREMLGETDLPAPIPTRDGILM